MTSNAFSSFHSHHYLKLSKLHRYHELNLSQHSDRRLADHFGGKLHLGYMLIREKLKELQVNSCMPCPNTFRMLKIDEIN